MGRGQDAVPHPVVHRAAPPRGEIQPQMLPALCWRKAQHGAPPPPDAQDRMGLPLLAGLASPAVIRTAGGNLRPFRALHLKQCGTRHQREFLVQSISQSASTRWNSWCVPGTY